VARKRIPRSLPPLSEILSGVAGSGSPDQGSKQAVLVRELRKAAKRFRKKRAQPFYAMREVAGFFHAPLRSVAVAYQVLEDEGLLNCIRSAQTLLTGSADSTQRTVRGVVGIPLWLLSMVISPHTRALHIALEERLRQKGYVAEFIFFRTDENCQPEFAERLLRHDLNYVIWHTPHPLGAQVQIAMEERGIRQIVIQPADSPQSYLPPNYLLDWQPAYRAMAQAWRAAGIRRIFIPTPRYLPSSQAMDLFCKLIKTYDMDIDVVEGNLRTFVKLAGEHPSSSVAFMDQQGADLLCNKDPAALEQLLRITRVAFCRGPISLPYFMNRPAHADIIGFAAEEIADRLVNDLAHQLGQGAQPPHSFEAFYHPREALNGPKESL